MSGKIAGADKSGRMGSRDFLAKNFLPLRAPPGDLKVP